MYLVMKTVSVIEDTNLVSTSTKLGLYQTLMLFDLDTLTCFICFSTMLGKPNQKLLMSEKYITYISNLLVQTVIFFNLNPRYDSVFGSMYRTSGKMWMLSVSCSLVSIYCYNRHHFSCVLSLLIHNCCSECLYILLHQVILKINYQSNVLLSNSRIIITVLFYIEFNIARAHTVWSLLSCLWSMLCGASRF